MNRTQAMLYLQHQLGDVLKEVGIDITWLEPAIDDALLLTGVAYGDLPTTTVADADVVGFRAVLRYAGLRWVYDRALNRVDIQISDPNVSKNRSQFVRQLEESVKRAKVEADPYMVSDATAAFSTGAIIFGERTVPPDLAVDAWAVS